MASSPTYNANLMAQPSGYKKVKKIKGTCGDATALQNNATPGLYPPGSTFKMVTAAAALDSGAYTPSSPLLRPRLLHRVRAARLERGQPGPDRAGGLRQRHARPGLRALDQLGLLQRRQAHRRREDPRLREAVRLLLAAAARDAAERAPRRPASTRTGSSATPTSDVADRSGPARVRPVQHARHAAADGARGRRRSRTTASEPQPYLVQKIVAPDGCPSARRRRRHSASRSSPQTAAELNQMMQLVVQGGTAAGVGFPRASRSPARRAPPSSASGASTTRGSSASPRPTTRATSSRSSSRSSRTASAPRSRPRSPRPSSKNSCTAEHVFTL